MKKITRHAACTLSYNEALGIQAQHIKAYAEIHNLTSDQIRLLELKVAEHTYSAADAYNVYDIEADQQVKSRDLSFVPRGTVIDKYARDIKA